jgi:hypothetical protein
LKIEGKTVFDLTTNIEMNGKIGIGASKGNVLLDNIAYYFPASFVQEDSFHDHVYHDYIFHYDRPEKSTKPFDKMKIGHNDWWILSGKWEKNREEDTEDMRGTIDTVKNIEKPAILIWGNDFWKDYTFNVATKVKDDSGFGVCAYFQDSLNYYLFKWLHEKDGCYKRQLLKIEDGKENILASDNEVFVIDTWYDMGIKIFRDSLIAIVNNKSVFTATDHTFKEGRLGFWTNSRQNVHFDDIKLNVSDSISEITNTGNYFFYTANGKPIARSLSIWDPNSQKSIYYHHAVGRCYLSKKVFEDVVINYNNTLPENFKIEVNTGHVPQDIDAVFEFSSHCEMPIVYKIILSNDKIILLKNGKMLVSDSVNYDREKIEIHRQNDVWIIKFAAKKIFEYSEKNGIKHWNMSIGYSGIGIGQIFLDHIIIEDHLLNN